MPVSTECAAVLLSFRYPSIVTYIFLLLSKEAHAVARDRGLRTVEIHAGAYFFFYRVFLEEKLEQKLLAHCLGTPCCTLSVSFRWDLEKKVTWVAYTLRNCYFEFFRFVSSNFGWKKQSGLCPLPANIFILWKLASVRIAFNELVIKGVCISSQNLIRLQVWFCSVFSYDVTTAILVSQNSETAAMLVSQTNPVGVELFSCVNSFYHSNRFA